MKEVWTDRKSTKRWLTNNCHRTVNEIYLQRRNGPNPRAKEDEQFKFDPYPDQQVLLTRCHRLRFNRGLRLATAKSALLRCSAITRVCVYAVILADFPEFARCDGKMRSLVTPVHVQPWPRRVWYTLQAVTGASYLAHNGCADGGQRSLNVQCNFQPRFSCQRIDQSRRRSLLPFQTCP